jgi:hypothetical protein
VPLPVPLEFVVIQLALLTVVHEQFAAVETVNDPVLAEAIKI